MPDSFKKNQAFFSSHDTLDSPMEKRVRVRDSGLQEWQCRSESEFALKKGELGKWIFLLRK